MSKISLATHLIIIGEQAAPLVLCEKHATALKDLLEKAAVDYASYTIDGHKEQESDTALDLEESLCQACHLSEATKPEIILPH